MKARRAQIVVCVSAAAALLLGAVYLSILPSVFSASLSPSSDTINTSVPSATSTHTIVFSTSTAIPASGKIVLTPQSGYWSLSSALDYTDLDLSVGGGDRSLAASASGTDDGVSINTGTGVITITLNSTSGIAGGTVVQIEVGENATYGTTGDWSPVNTSTTGSYRLTIETKNSADTVLDTGRAMIAIVQQVSVQSQLISTAPARSNGLPSGLLAANNPVIEVTLETDKPATCRYATSTGVAYTSMTANFTNLSDQFFQAVISGHQNSTTYNYYVRCRANDQGVVNDDDYTISFSLDSTPSNNTSIVASGISGTGGHGVLGGSDTLFLANVSVSGLAMPLGRVTILRDGTLAGSVSSNDLGKFSFLSTGLERGAYTFLAYATDSKGRKSSSFTSTLTVGQGTNNSISNIVIPPTIDLVERSVPTGGTVQVIGESIPQSSIEVEIVPQEGGTAKFYHASSTSGSWNVTFGASNLARGTYTVRARSTLSSGEISNYSTIAFLGVGVAATPSACGTPDINGDTKINLIDFSIFLTHWGTSAGEADFNCDKTVNLADFSIMLFNWTG